jgi:predicted XRE-type DNA-binding protein
MKFPSQKELQKMRPLLEKGPASRPLPKNASPSEHLKYQLCEKFVIYHNEYKTTQKELAKQIGIDAALMSKILHYQYDEFTIDRLISFLAQIYPKIDLKIKVA